HGPRKHPGDYPRTRPGDFAISLLVLLGHVMKADKKLLKSELTFVKGFLTQNFGAQNSRDLMMVFKDILKQEYPLQEVCHQIKKEMDHAARLELVHGLFGLAHADGHLHPKEDEAIRRICGYIGVYPADFDSMRAMYVQQAAAAYTILEIDPSISDDQVKRAYRKMAAKFHPDKVAHLGDEFGKLAEEKFKAVNEAYGKIKKERGMK
ncbi:MAG: TerB family tellurite resistance protein, partial [Candidatus Neomarinimicrobiota bacterium]|nr:TerB family tellurite resistance protein [Candidatus Neomarinimicrobiota bacterium]